MWRKKTLEAQFSRVRDNSDCESLEVAIIRYVLQSHTDVLSMCLCFNELKLGQENEQR